MQDMAKYPYLKRSGKRGILSYRRSVPPILRAIVGKREILMSFGTSSLEDALPQYHFIAAEADKELDIARAEWDWQQDAAEAEVEGGYTDIGGLIPQLLSGQHADPAEQCKRYYAECQERERDFRYETTKKVTKDPDAFWRGEIIGLPMSRAQFYALPEFARFKASNDGFKYLLAMAYRKRLEQRLMMLRAMLVTHDFEALEATFACCSACARTMGLAFTHTEIRLISDVLADDAALLPMPVALGSDFPAAPVVASLPTNVGGPLLSAAGQDWIAAHSMGRSAWSSERSALCKRVLADFIDVCGDEPLSAYRKSDGRAFVALLRRLPANIDKRTLSLGLDGRDLSAIADAAEARALEPQDDSNVNKKIGILHQCFRWLMTRYDECTASPVEGMKLSLRRSAREEREPFTTAQLNAIFTAPVFTGCQSDTHWRRPGLDMLRQSAKFWVPLIALFSGMRSGEICQLTRAHVRQHEGLHYFALTRELRLKNSASIRSVPVHRTLIECGFLEFVASCRDRLFPELVQHSSGRLSDAFGKHFARFLKSVGAKTERTDFHSFRHNFVAAADASGMEFAARERMVGHVLHGQAGRYGHRYEQEQQDMQLLVTRTIELQKLSFPGVRLDHLLGHGDGPRQP